MEKLEPFKNVFTSVGIYPHEDKNEEIKVLGEKLKNFIQIDKDKPSEKRKIVAIGECGIDLGSWENERKLEDQLDLFETQIKLALDFDLPVIVHNRNGDEQVLAMLRKYKNNGLRGVIHGTPSNRTWEICQKFLDFGYYLSFGGNITYPSNDRLRGIVKAVPDDKFLLETDSPYLPPQGHRGEVNHPKYVRIVAEKASQVKQKTFDEVSSLSCQNTCRLFNLSI